MDISDHATPETYAKQAWGTYYPNRYYFAIAVGKTREEAGLTTTKTDLTADEQRQLQWENYPAMIHEFLHYVHDLSTIVGQACLFNQVMMKSIFTKYAKNGLDTSESLGMNKAPDQSINFHSAFMFSRFLEGGGPLVTKMHQITGISEHEEAVTGRDQTAARTKMIAIPEIHYVEKTGQGDIRTSVKLGSFYLFECISYEIDQLVGERQGHPVMAGNARKGTEYTVCRMVAQSIHPHISMQNVARLALMALQGVNCGQSFIQMVTELKSNLDKGIPEEQTVAVIKGRVSRSLAGMEMMFAAQLQEYTRVFRGRSGLEASYAYLIGVSLDLYRKRIVDPCFELELIFEDKIRELLNVVQLCDFFYIFKDSEPPPPDPEFNRDYIGTALDADTSFALKTLVAFDHYFSMHYVQKTKDIEKKVAENCRCPFYSTCDLPYRRDHAVLCLTKPWRIYELQYKKDKEYCWYGTGVLEAKGLTFKKPKPADDQPPG